MRRSSRLERPLAQLYVDQATVFDPVFPNAVSIGRTFPHLEAN